jgi:uncharacterized protein (TIGR02611 family)
METMKHKWKQLPVAIRKPLILILGTIIIIAGIILLPLPGPGWVIIFFGFAVLATEFAFAERLRDWTIVQLKAALAWTKTKWHTLTNKPPEHR